MSVTAWKNPVCAFCDVKYRNMQDLNKHMKNIHFETDSMRLDRLELLAISGSKLKSAIVPSVDTLTIKEEKNNKSTDCTDCGILFKTKEAYATHIEEQHLKKVEEVKVCDKSEVTKNGLNNHMESCHDDSKRVNSVECLLCKNMFAYRSAVSNIRP